MQEISVSGIRLYFDEHDRGTVDLAQQACLKTMRIVDEHWGVDPPEDCRVYIMDSWVEFMFRSAPGPWKILLAVTLPLWVFRVRRMWPYVGGWEQSYGARRTVGVKSPELLEQADRSLGAHIFIDWKDISEHFQSIMCHELTHAFTSHLKLPTWLKEGLAMLAVDKALEKPTVRVDSLEALEQWSGEERFQGTQRLDVRDEDTIVYLYLRGYWLTRYIDEVQPGLLNVLLSGNIQPGAYEEKTAKALQKNPETFWDEVDEELVTYFEQSAGAV